MPMKEGCFVSAENIDMDLKSRTNEFLCFLKVSPSIITVMPEMLMCNRHLLPAGTIPRAVSPGAGALLLCTWPVAGKKKGKKNCSEVCRELLLRL